MTTVLTSIAEELGVHERTLRRAVSQGTLHATRPTPRTLDLSLSERQYVRRSWGVLAELRSVLRTEHNVRFALLFGSAARGTDRFGSDLDVLVDLHDASFERVVDLGARLSARLGRQVELVRFEDAETDPAFLAEALDEGRVLVDRDRRWPRLQRGLASLRRRARRVQSQRTRAALEGIDRLLAG